MLSVYLVQSSVCVQPEPLRDCFCSSDEALSRNVPLRGAISPRSERGMRSIVRIYCTWLRSDRGKLRAASKTFRELPAVSCSCRLQQQFREHLYAVCIDYANKAAAVGVPPRCVPCPMAPVKVAEQSSYDKHADMLLPVVYAFTQKMRGFRNFKPKSTCRQTSPWVFVRPPPRQAGVFLVLSLS